MNGKSISQNNLIWHF